MDEKIKNKNNDEIDLIELSLKLWSYRKLIIYITSAFIIIGIVYTLLAKQWYQSQVTLFKVYSGQTAPSGLSSIASQFGFGSTLEKTQDYSLEGVFFSKRVCKKIIFNKWNSVEFEDKVDLIKYFQIDEETDLEEFEKAYAYFKDLISINRNMENLVITIAVMMPEAQLAADIANYIPELLSEYVQNEQQSNLKRNLEYIELRLDTVKRELKQAEEELKEFREKNRIIAESPELQLEYGRLQREVTIWQEVYLTLIKEYEMAQIELIKETPVLSIIDEAVPPIKREKPKRKRIVIIFAFLGGFLSLLGVIVYEVYLYLRKSYRERIAENGIRKPETGIQHSATSIG
ncbi:Wzz/FepE/Etk N-terminal domain-containing protein [Bacteroidota bacterium]